MTALKPVTETLSPITAVVSEVLSVDEFTALIILSNLFAILLLFLILICVRHGKSTKGRTIVLAGLSDAGKTRIFCELVGAHAAESYASMKENVMDMLTIGSKVWKLVDVPGADRIRTFILDKFLPETRGLIFVIDSVRFTREAKDVAEFLYDILSNPVSKNLPILVACNKQDQGFAKSAKLIRSNLEKEFGLLTHSRIAALETTDGSSAKRIVGKGDSGNFSFDELPKKNVDFIECISVVTNGHKCADMSEIEKWCSTL